MTRVLNRWREGRLLLGIARGLALALALALLFLFPGTSPLFVPRELLIGLVIPYTIARIIYPFHWYNKHYVNYLILAAEVLLCCFLPFASGGYQSPFILYPLTAVLFTALLFPRSLAYLAAGAASISVVCTEIFLEEYYGLQMLMPGQVYIALMAMYVIVAFLISWLPYVDNINLYSIVKQRAIVDERRRLSREIHDGLAQQLSSLLLKMDVLQMKLKGIGDKGILDQAADLRNDLRDAHHEVRDVIDQLRMRVSDNPAIIPTLARSTREFTEDTGIKCQLYLADEQTELPPLATVELLRVVQEALTNVKKHSGANQVEVRFESKPNLVRVVIKDNGHGFSPGGVKNRHGLAVMQERAQSLGGRCEIMSSPGVGTEIQVTVPLSNSPSGGKIG